MATYFGEVKPFSSRAVDDDEPDNQPKYNVFVENIVQKTQSAIKLIIFSVGDIASIFVKSQFLPDNSKLICSVKYSLDKVDDDDSMLYTGAQSKILKNVTAASLFTSDSDVLICDIPKFLPDEICYEVAASILKEFPPTQVLIVASKHMAAFIKEEDTSTIETPFLKSVGTSLFHDSYTCNIQRLEPPNFLCSISASILLRCELMKLPALCIINFVDTDVVDSINVNTFDTILEETIVSELTVNSDAEARVVKAVKARQTNESNIYA